MPGEMPPCEVPLPVPCAAAVCAAPTPILAGSSRQGQAGVGTCQLMVLKARRSLLTSHSVIRAG